MNPEPESACVVLFHPVSGRILAELHSDGVGLPGGKREPEDRDSLACAARELFEETGVVLYSARPVLVYRAGNRWCETWLAVEFELPERWPPGARADWVTEPDLVGLGARFPRYSAQILERLRVGGFGPLRLVVWS